MDEMPIRVRIISRSAVECSKQSQQKLEASQQLAQAVLSLAQLSPSLFLIFSIGGLDRVGI